MPPKKDGSGITTARGEVLRFKSPIPPRPGGLRARYWLTASVANRWRKPARITLKVSAVQPSECWRLLLNVILKLLIIKDYFYLQVRYF